MATGCLSDGNSDKQQQASQWVCFPPVLLMFLLVFTQAQSLSKAMLAHERALEWQELFDLAVRTSMAEGNIVTTGYRIAGLLGPYSYQY